MKKAIILFAFCVLVIQGCMSPEKKNCLKQIDSLKELIDSAKLLYSKIDSAAIFASFNNYKKLQDEAGTFSGMIKPSDPGWEYLIPFANIEKPYRKALQRYLKMPDEISFSANQLKNLSQDVKNDLISPEKFKEYFQSESEAIRDMYMRIKFFNKDIDFFNDRIDTLDKKVIPLLEQLRKSPLNKNVKTIPAQEGDD